MYIGAIGGGIWKTPDITLTTPTWTPITNTLGTTSIGSFDIDPTNSNVINAGLGDYWEGNTGGVMVTSTNGGTTWGAPRPLTVVLNNTSVKAVNIRTVKIDPNNNRNILVAADVGLFRSTNGGATYSAIDLPNTTPYGIDLEGGFSIVYTGLTDGKSTFLVSGNYACPGTFPPSFNQPTTGFFVATCPGLPTGSGNLGDIWKSTDARRDLDLDPRGRRAAGAGRMARWDGSTWRRYPGRRTAARPRSSTRSAATRPARPRSA